MKRVLVLLTIALSGVAYTAPLFPTITGYDFNFGAYNNQQVTGAPAYPEYWLNGINPDTLTYTRGMNDHEVTGFWPNWPNGNPDPVFNGQVFGGDFVMAVKFTGQDAPYTHINNKPIDVSLVGTGAGIENAGIFGADLEIWGTINTMGSPTLLWSLKLDKVSLYGYSGDKSFVLEGIGTILGGEVADIYQLKGRMGVMRGQVDLINTYGPPPLYDPLQFPGEGAYRMAFSGETGAGAVPGPAGVLAFSFGVALALLRRRR